MDNKQLKPYVAEFVGTFFLVAFICGLASGGFGIEKPDLSPADIGILYGFVLMAIVYGIGAISGAHVNPAVTIAMWSIKKISPRDAGFYILAQVLGGIGGALLMKSFFLGRGSVVDYGAAHVSSNYLQGGNVWLALIAEALGAFAIVWAVMATAVSKDGNRAASGLAIGFSLGFAGMVLVPATGGSFNPARWLGPALASGTYPDFWLYIVGPIAGAVLAASLYQWLIGESDESESTNIADRK
jgi:MIP family channel proteins